MTDKEKTAAILKVLNRTFNNYADYCGIDEIRMSTGFSGTAMRRADFLTISSRNGNDVIVFEIKVSRQDFKKDIEKFDKQRTAKAISNYFYYVTPKGLLKPEEIPDWAGLIEIDLEQPEERRFTEHKIYAPRRHNEGPTWGLVAEIIRHLYNLSYVKAEELSKNYHTTLYKQIEDLKKENDRLRQTNKTLEKNNRELFLKVYSKED